MRPAKATRSSEFGRHVVAFGDVEDQIIIDADLKLPIRGGLDVGDLDQIMRVNVGFARNR